jgi:hypothetical protein
MILEHSYFELPADPDTTIWRYFSFTKFVSLLQSSSLHFARSDRFDDPFEGTVPDGAKEAIHASLATISTNPDVIAEEFIRLADLSRLYTFINCWHANPSESDAMWKLYSFANEGVAVQSTVGRLRRALEKAPYSILIGSVRYADFDSLDPHVFLNGLTPFIFKRSSFEHEREIRALIWMDAPSATESHPGDASLEVPTEIARSVPVDLPDLIQRVVVSPTAPQWFGELVEMTCRRHGLLSPVSRSRLYELPRRREAQEPNRSPSIPFSLTREILDYLHQQHLQYTELQIRERERLGARQSEAIASWIDGIERDLDALQFRSGGELISGRRAISDLASEISNLTLDQILEAPAFGHLYFISGRIDNVHREITESVLPPAEIDLHLRRMIFLYTEVLARPQIQLLAKLQQEHIDPESLDESKQTIVRLLIQQCLRLTELMNSQAI